MNRIAVVCIGCAALASASQAQTILPDDPRIAYSGRVDRSDPLQPVLGWSGTSISASFQGTSLRATFDDSGENYVYVIVDGGAPQNFRLARPNATYVLASGLGDTTHQVEIIKKTEGAFYDSLTFRGFELDPGRELNSLPPAPGLRLEFYGDSNAAGYSAECTCDSGDAQYNNVYLSFVGQTSRMLGAEFSAITWSGIGLVRTPTKMSQRWDRVLPLSAAPLWDFSQWKPDAVVVDLGANDYYWGVNESEMLAGWVDFVSNDLRSAYPDAHIVLVQSFGWAYNEPADYLQQAVDTLHLAGDTNVSMVLFPWLWGQEHAVACEQAGFANILAPHLATVLGLPAPILLESSCLGAPGRVANGSLEAGSFTEIDGWRVDSLATGRVVPVHDPSGNRYARLLLGAVGEARINQGTLARPEAQYTALAYLRSPSASSATLRASFKDTAQVEIQAYDLTPASLPTDWTRFAVATGAAPLDATQVAVTLVTATPHSSVEVDDVALACTGDLNDDQLVELSDLGALLANYGRSGDVEWEDGDLDLDGEVGLSDVGLLLATYGNNCRPN